MAISPQRLMIYLYYSAHRAVVHRAVVFAIAQLSCYPIVFALHFCQKLRLSAFSLKNKMNE